VPVLINRRPTSAPSLHITNAALALSLLHKRNNFAGEGIHARKQVSIPVQEGVYLLFCGTRCRRYLISTSTIQFAEGHRLFGKRPLVLSAFLHRNAPNHRSRELVHVEPVTSRSKQPRVLAEVCEPAHLDVIEVRRPQLVPFVGQHTAPDNRAAIAPRGKS